MPEQDEMEQIEVNRVVVVEGMTYAPGGTYEVPPHVAQKLRDKQRLVEGGSQQSSSPGGEGESGSPPQSDLVAEENAAQLAKLQGPIPDDCPGRAKLADNDITELEQLAQMSREELTQLEGIGDATADKIGDALTELIEQQDEGPQG